MARQENLIGLAVATVIGAGTFAAVKYGLLKRTGEAIQEQLVEQIASNIERRNLTTSELDNFCEKIPGPWKVSEYIAGLLAKPGSDWESHFVPLDDPRRGREIYHFQHRETHPRFESLGLKLLKEYTPPTGFARLIHGGAASEATMKNYLAGIKF